MARSLAVQCAICVFALAGCVERSEPPVTQDGGLADSLRSAEIPDQESENARIIFYKGSYKSADIQAEYIWKFTRKDSTAARNLVVDLYDSLGAVATHMVADSGFIKQERNSMTGLGNVVVTTTDSSRLESEELTWDNRSEQITSPLHVLMISNGDTLSGVGFQSDRNLKKIKIFNKARGSLSGDRMAPK